MSTRSIDDAVRAGEPMIEFTVSFHKGVDYVEATRRLNLLGPDIEVDEGDWYNLPYLRRGILTAEGMYRIFGAKLERVRISELYPDTFMWSYQPIAEWPIEFEGVIEEVGVTQPGSDDNGKYYVPLFPD